MEKLDKSINSSMNLWRWQVSQAKIMRKKSTSVSKESRIAQTWLKIYDSLNCRESKNKPLECRIISDTSIVCLKVQSMTAISSKIHLRIHRFQHQTWSKSNRKIKKKRTSPRSRKFFQQLRARQKRETSLTSSTGILNPRSSSTVTT